MSEVQLPSAEVGRGEIDFKPLVLSPISETGLREEPHDVGVTSPSRGHSKDSYVTQEGDHPLPGKIVEKMNDDEEDDLQLDTPHDIYCKAKEYERENDLMRAQALFGEAAEQGHLCAMVSYALLLVGTDEAMAFEWLTTAAEHGSGRAYYHLGQLFARGALFRISPTTAAKCWRQAAALGDSGGRSALGLCYIRGFGVKQNVEKGVAIVKQVAIVEQSLCAMKNLSWIYKHGKGVEKDVEQADMWWKKALDRQAALDEAEENWVAWKISPI